MRNRGPGRALNFRPTFVQHHYSPLTTLVHGRVNEMLCHEMSGKALKWLIYLEAISRNRTGIDCSLRNKI